MDGWRPTALEVGSGSAPPAVRPPAGPSRCRCGRSANATCAGGCGGPTCGEHLLSGSSHLAAPGPYESEREHTAYLRAYWAFAGPQCAWCREDAGRSAVALLPPVAPLPSEVLARLSLLLDHPHDYPSGEWDRTVRQHGGPARLLRLLAPRLWQLKEPQRFEGRRRGEVLVGVTVGVPGVAGTCDVVDADGGVWTARLLPESGRRRWRAWDWEPASAERVGRLLPHIVATAR